MRNGQSKTAFERWFASRFVTQLDAAKALGWSRRKFVWVLRGKQPASLRDAEQITAMSDGMITAADLLAHYRARRDDTNNVSSAEAA